MIDLKFLRENPDLVKENIKKKIIRNIDPISALSIIIGNMHFPIMAPTLLKKIGG